MKRIICVLLLACFVLAAGCAKGANSGKSPGEAVVSKEPLSSAAEDPSLTSGPALEPTPEPTPQPTPEPTDTPIPWPVDPYGNIPPEVEIYFLDPSAQQFFSGCIVVQNGEYVFQVWESGYLTREVVMIPEMVEDIKKFRTFPQGTEEDFYAVEKNSGMFMFYYTSPTVTILVETSHFSLSVNRQAIWFIREPNVCIKYRFGESHCTVYTFPEDYVLITTMYGEVINTVTGNYHPLDDYFAESVHQEPIG